MINSPPDRGNSLFLQDISEANQNLSTINQDIQEEEDQDLRCPIGLDYMRHPVEIKNCKHVFEKENILTWLKRSNTCPFDRRVITKEDLVLDEELQKKIADYLLENPDKRISDEEDRSTSNEKIELPRQNHWRMTLRRTHQVSSAFLIVSTYFFLNNLFVDEDQNTLKAGAFYMMCGSGGLAVMTASPVIKQLKMWKDFRTHFTNYRD